MLGNNPMRRLQANPGHRGAVVTTGHNAHRYKHVACPVERRNVARVCQILALNFLTISVCVHLENYATAAVDQRVGVLRHDEVHESALGQVGQLRVSFAGCDNVCYATLAQLDHQIYRHFVRDADASCEELVRCLVLSFLQSSMALLPQRCARRRAVNYLILLRDQRCSVENEKRSHAALQQQVDALEAEMDMSTEECRR
eukprot:scaffold387_cov244-Pinguiococcus_pyrenoidosus.AAC.5